MSFMDYYKKKIKENTKYFYKLLFILFWLLSSCQKEGKTFFSQLTSNDTQIYFSNDFLESENLNIIEYLYAYNGGGVAIGDINNDGLADIYFTANQMPNKLYLNKGNLRFEDITITANVAGPSGVNSWSTGATMADVNGDGYLDIYLSVVGSYKQLKGHNRLFINNGDLTFAESSEAYNLDLVGFCQQAYFFDYDLDGDLDMYQLRHAIHKPEVYKDSSIRRKRDSLSGDLLLKNENNKFIDVTDISGISSGSSGYGLAAGVADLDNNGCPDIYISNDFHENDFLYFNNCDGTFRERGTESMGHTSRFSMGNDIADFNNDGLLDIFTTDMKPFDEVIRKKSAAEASPEIYDFRLSFGYQNQYSRNMLQLNRGPLFGIRAQFSEVGQQAGIQATDWSWAPLIVDLDNDGWKDLFITNGIRHRPNDLDYINFAHNEYAKTLSNQELVNIMPDGVVHNFVFKNNGKIEFIDVSKEWGLDHKGYSMGASYGDLDNDGDIDLVVNNLNGEAVVYRNNTQQLYNTNYLQVKLIGPPKNRFGIGAKVTVLTGHNKQTLELNPSRGWLSSTDYKMHFGLGKIKKIVSVKVIWPDGKNQVLREVNINSVLKLEYKHALTLPKTQVEIPKVFTSNELGNITYKHNENKFNDFQTERLLLRKLSTEGPKIALGDVNGDGLTDLYISGGSNQAGELYIRNDKEKSHFTKSKINSFEEDSSFEDTDAVFFDLDADGDQDLYVVSGGGEKRSYKKLEDRIYLNDGNGNFEHFLSQNKVILNGSTVIANDFDEDGCVDIFIGARSLNGSYGLSPRSTILWNQGNGNLIPDSKVDSFLHLGMVTDAIFLEDSKELFVVGEWMPITIIDFKGRNLSIRHILKSSGWWNTIHADDMDGDGDQDLLVGNQGTNSGFKPTSEFPLGLYVKDFDGNGSTDPIFTYWKHGKEWVYQDLDELKGQMVSFRKQFQNYGDFAEKTADQVITKSMRKDMVFRKAETLESVYLENQGSGHFFMKPLPKEAQWSSIFGFETADFDGDNLMDIVTVGNFYSHPPSIGRADASYGNFLKGVGNNKFQSIEPRYSGWVISGEARDVKLLSINKKHPILLISRNNDIPLIFKFKKQGKLLENGF